MLALLLAGLLPLLRRRRAEVRYAAAAGALASLLLSVGLTFGSYYHAAPGAGLAAEVAQPVAPAASVQCPTSKPSGSKVTPPSRGLDGESAGSADRSRFRARRRASS